MYTSLGSAYLALNKKKVEKRIQQQQRKINQELTNTSLVSFVKQLHINHIFFIELASVLVELLAEFDSYNAPSKKTTQGDTTYLKHIGELMFLADFHWKEAQDNLADSHLTDEQKKTLLPYTIDKNNPNGLYIEALPDYMQFHKIGLNTGALKKTISQYVYMHKELKDSISGSLNINKLQESVYLKAARTLVSRLHALFTYQHRCMLHLLTIQSVEPSSRILNHLVADIPDQARMHIEVNMHLIIQQKYRFKLLKHLALCTGYHKIKYNETKDLFLAWENKSSPLHFHKYLREENFIPYLESCFDFDGYQHTQSVPPTLLTLLDCVPSKTALELLSIIATKLERTKDSKLYSKLSAVYIISAIQLNNSSHNWKKFLLDKSEAMYSDQVTNIADILCRHNSLGPSGVDALEESLHFYCYSTSSRRSKLLALVTQMYLLSFTNHPNDSILELFELVPDLFKNEHFIKELCKPFHGEIFNRYSDTHPQVIEYQETALSFILILEVKNKRFYNIFKHTDTLLCDEFQNALFSFFTVKHRRFQRNRHERQQEIIMKLTVGTWGTHAARTLGIENLLSVILYSQGMLCAPIRNKGVIYDSLRAHEIIPTKGIPVLYFLLIDNNNLSILNKINKWRKLFPTTMSNESSCVTATCSLSSYVPNQADREKFIYMNNPVPEDSKPWLNKLLNFITDLPQGRLKFLQMAEHYPNLLKHEDWIKEFLEFKPVLVTIPALGLLSQLQDKNILPFLERFINDPDNSKLLAGLIENKDNIRALRSFGLQRRDHIELKELNESDRNTCTEILQEGRQRQRELGNHASVFSLQGS